MAAKTEPKDQRVAHWGRELERAKKRFRLFWEQGDNVIDEYRLQKADSSEANSKDKYNILYSSTETIRPNLYAQSPRTIVKLRNRDAARDDARMAALLLEGCLEYVKDEEDFDELMTGAVEDLLLPGLGTGWVRYEATFGDKKDEKGQPIPREGGKKGEYEQELLDEMVKMEYVYWQDWLCGVARTWKQVPWVAKRLWLTREAATKRFGQEKARQLQYQSREATAREQDTPGETAEVWEIWNKADRRVYWLADSCAEFLDERDDPLRLKHFFPCPKPLRAVSNTRTFVPRALYSQYKSQAGTLNTMTKRIRLLTEALKVTGAYDGSQPKLADLLNPSSGNRMIAVDGWALFAQNGGINGAVVWVPIDIVVKVLNELLQAREVAKAEIYEITGFSDIVRGVSKASETLGAQNLKANWASARVKRMQKSVQDFARDMLALAGEVIAEHCSPETIAVFSGIRIPTGEEMQTNPEAQQTLALFKASCDLLKNELRRISSVNIETDSTIMADEAVEREDRQKFLAAAGAFLQQAVPAMEATPELGPLLGALLMFTVRSFPSARIIEEEFEKVQRSMAARQPQPDKDGKQAKNALDQQKLQQDAQLKTQEMTQKSENDQATLALDTQKEQNRHDEKMIELSIKERELALKEQELALKERELAHKEKTESFKALHDAGMREEEFGAGRADAANTRVDERTDAEREDAHRDADREQDADRLDREDAHRDADRDAQERAAEAQEADQAPKGSDDA